MTQKLIEVIQVFKEKPTTEEGNLAEFWDEDIDSNIDDEWFEKVQKLLKRGSEENE